MPGKREEYRDYIEQQIAKICDLLENYPKHKAKTQEEQGYLGYMLSFVLGDWSQYTPIVLKKFKNDIQSKKNENSLSLNALIEILEELVNHYFTHWLKKSFGSSGGSELKASLLNKLAECKQKSVEFKENDKIDISLSYEQHPPLVYEQETLPIEKIQDTITRVSKNDSLVQFSLEQLFLPSRSIIAKEPVKPFFSEIKTIPTPKNSAPQKTIGDKISDFFKGILDDSDDEKQTPLSKKMDFS